MSESHAEQIEIRRLRVASALEHLKEEREQVQRGYHGRSSLDQTEAVALGDEVLALRTEQDALREALERVRSHAHGMPPSTGAGWIIAVCNEALAALPTPKQETG